MKPIVLLDLDRMLYDTDRFSADMLGVLHNRFNIDLEQYGAEYAKYYVYHGEMRHYDFFRHIEHYGLDGDEVELALETDLAGREYTYDDVPDFLQQVRPLAERLLVLTHGEHRFQYLKFSLSAALQGLPFKDVLTHKREYIAERFAGQHGVLIDDHQVGKLPDGFAHIWVSRYGAQGAHHGLAEVLSLLHFAD